MALSVELLNRLNSSEEPLPKRLKLAENSFYAVDLPMVHREDLILQWLCKMCSKEQQVWNSLKTCLKIKHLDIKSDVYKLLMELLIGTFQKDIKYIQEDIFECCSLLISNSGIQQYYINKPEDLEHLIKSLLECVHKIFKDTFNVEEDVINGISISLINEHNGLVLKAYNTTVCIIENTTQIFKSASITKENLKKMFICDILYPLCRIIDHKCADTTNRLGAVTYKSIQQLIFGRKYLQNGELLKDEDMMQLKHLLSILTENAKRKSLQDNLMALTFFFRVAVSTFKSDTAILDLILRDLSEYSETSKKEIFNSFLKHLNDVTFDFNNKIQDVTLFDYCQNMIDEILRSKSISNTDCDLLTQFCYFNPLLIERRVTDILRKLFVDKSLLEYKNVMISILDALIHLKQEEKFISSILVALKDCSNQITLTENNTLIPDELKEKLMIAINNITNSQSVVMFRTLSYYLKTYCLEQFTDVCADNNFLMLQITIELLVIFLDHICVFEYNGTSAFYKKIINGFHDLKNILSVLIEKILCVNYNDMIIMLLITIIFSWNEAQRALKYYMPSIPLNNSELISENQWQKLFKRVKKRGSKKCKNNMNRLILQQVKITQNALDKSSTMLNNLIGGVECCWPLILKSDVQIISYLNNEQLSKVTDLLLVEIVSNPHDFNEWINVLNKNGLQEDKRLILSILNSVFTQIGQLTTEDEIKTLCKSINVELLLEAETAKCEEVNRILMSINKKLFVYKSVQIPNISLCKIKFYLEVLFNLPLMFLSTSVKLITFIFLFGLRMECNQCNEIVSLCNTILSDLLERPAIDIFQYIDPAVSLQYLRQDRRVQKTLELYLRNCSYANLKKLVKCFINSNTNMLFLLESMQHVKSKLSVEQKAIVKKAENKLIKVVMVSLPSEMTTDDIKILILLLRINITSETIDQKLEDVTKSIMQNIFVKDNVTNELLESGLQLMSVVLRNKKLFHVTDQIIRGVWSALFKYPSGDVLLPLLESSEMKLLSEFLEELDNQLMQSFLHLEKNNLENICTIWNAILKTNMSTERNRLRLAAINNLVETLQTVNIPAKFLSDILKVIQNIFNTKHLHLPGYVIDMSITFGLRILQQNTLLICNDTLVLCSVLLRTRTNLITDRMPSLLLLYRRIISIVTHRSKAIINKSEEHLLKCLALDIEKFTSALIKLKKDMIRISPYLVADLLELFSENSIASFIKDSLQNCINQLISICDQHGIALLSRILPVSMQEIFKTQLTVYNKFYKFSGKI